MTIKQPVLSAEQVWRAYDAVESRLTAPVSERMLDLAGLRPGMSLLDLASGRGEPALRAARRVGPQGRVVAVELSDALLQIAREHAQREGLTNLELRAANAEHVAGLAAGSFDAATIRWGLMYMAEPIAALDSAHRALAPHGALVVAVWAEPERVPYATLPRSLFARHRELPPLDPESPGTFRYATLEALQRDLERAGFTVDHVEEMDIPVIEAETASEIVAWVRAIGWTKLLNDLPESEQRAWERDLAHALESDRTGALLRLGGVTRLVRARPLCARR